MVTISIEPLSWAYRTLHLSLTHSPSFLVQLKTVHSLSLILNNIKIASIATCFGLTWPSSGNYSPFETVALH
jgi:hypothetical protein